VGLFPSKLIISASRRQDLPGGAFERLLAQLGAREFVWRQPYSGKEQRLAFTAAEVFCLALWSKDFGPLLASNEAGTLVDPLRPYFIFTVNHAPELERGLTTPLPARLAQATTIARRYGPGRLQWRFDPIVHWETATGERRDNLAAFPEICRHMAGLGVARCTISFAQLYGKVLRRQRRLSLTFLDPPLAEQLEIVSRLAQVASPLGVQLQACCAPELVAQHPALEPAACIDGPYLTTVIDADPAGLDLSAHPSRDGCNCTRSIDVGTYEACPHRCAYCYAYPSLE
jgi:hypothetical protein